MTAANPSLLSYLTERKMIAQASDRDALARNIDDGAMTFYIGIDPTGSSLHSGHLVPLYLLVALARKGNRPIVIVGDGTARIGDPSGKSEMRPLIDNDAVARNADVIEKQIRDILSRFDIKAQFVRNGEWLNDLNYIEFLRDIGSRFSVNHMLTFESVRRRLAQQQGLSFLEFNYMLLQAYDFLMLNQRYGCTLQIAGDDQWGNMVAGIDLIRRKERRQAYALTSPLILTAGGEKMGKTAEGALFLNTKWTSVFDYYQYWRNIDDHDIGDCLLRFTDAAADEWLTPDSDQREINSAKARLAREMTAFAHGERAAQEAERSARTLFGDAAATATGAAMADGGTAATGAAMADGGTAADGATTGDSAADADGATTAGGAGIPGGTISVAELAAGIPAINLFASTPLCSSKAEARRLIQQSGARINGTQITDADTVIDGAWLADGQLLLKAGKKRIWLLTATDE